MSLKEIIVILAVVAMMAYYVFKPLILKDNSDGNG